MALYDTRFGLGQNVVDYLNQPLPDVSGIRSVYQPSPQIAFQEPVEQVQNVGLTPEEILLLRSNLIPQSYGGNDDDFSGNIDTTNNAGITSIGGLFDAIKNDTNIGSVIGGLAFGPVGAFLGSKVNNALSGDPGGPGGDGEGNLDGMGPSAFGPGLGEIDANAGFGPFTDTGQVTADGNNMGGGSVGGPTGGATDGTSTQGSGSADDGFARGGRVQYLYGGLTSLL